MTMHDKYQITSQKLEEMGELFKGLCNTHYSNSYFSNWFLMTAVEFDLRAAVFVNEGRILQYFVFCFLGHMKAAMELSLPPAADFLKNLSTPRVTNFKAPKTGSLFILSTASQCRRLQQMSFVSLDDPRVV